MRRSVRNGAAVRGETLKARPCGIRGWTIPVAFESTQLNGITIINDLGGVSFANVRRETFKLISHSIQNCLPVRLGGIRLCRQPWFFPIVWGMFSPFLRRKVRERVVVCGWDMPLGLEKYVVLASIPRDLGGELDV